MTLSDQPEALASAIRDQKGWFGVSLTGTGHTIPPVCPNCLGPATVPLLYQRSGMQVLLSLLLPLSFFPFNRQSLRTFLYCESCANAARAATRRGRFLEIFSSFPVQFLLVFPPFAMLLWYAEEWILPGLLLLPALGIPMMIFLGRWVDKASLRCTMRSHPQRDGQAVWGHAVYYQAPYLLFKWEGGYHAARAEWLRALVEANPGYATDETYHQWVGRERPKDT